MDKKLYKFGMDWLNGVLPVSDVQSVFDLLGMFSSKLKQERWQLLNSGRYNYARRYCLDGNMTMQLMYNPVSEGNVMFADMNHNNSGIFFSISGDGIRYLHSLGGDVSALNKLLFYFYRNGFKASRFDTYCDILDETNEIVPLIQEAFSYARQEQVGRPFISTRLRRTNNNFKRYPVVDDNGIEWWNCQLGHHGSTVGMFRCYNKKVELSDVRLSDLSSDIFSSYKVDNYWYRLEYEMHKENAAVCFNALMSRAEEENSPLCFEDIFYSVFERVFKVCESNSLAVMANGSAPSCSAWASFASDLQENSIHLVQFESVPYIKCTLSRLEKNARNIKGYFYAIGQYLNTLPLDERVRFMREARDNYESKARYNTLRDEIEELNILNKMKRDLMFSSSWRQVEFDSSIFTA